MTEELRKYWEQRGIHGEFPQKIKTERWFDKDTKEKRVETFCYYQTFSKPFECVDWQRTPLSDTTYPRNSLPKWMTPDGTYWLYIPQPWALYRNKPLVIVEGIPDTLTWWQVGIPAIGMKSAWIVQREDCQKQLKYFINAVQPERILVVPDGDFPNFFLPTHDNVRFWFNAFRKFTDLFLDFRWAHLSIFRDILFPSYLDLYQKYDGYLQYEAYKIWKRSWKRFPKMDSNDLWLENNQERPEFLEAVRLLVSQSPIMPPMSFPKKKKQEYRRVVSGDHERVGSLAEFITKFSLEVTDRSVNRWYRGLCPVERHKREGTTPERGAFGIFEGDARILLRCNAGCPEDLILSAIGAEEKDLWLKRR